MFCSYADKNNITEPERSGHVMGISGIYFQTAIMMGVLLLALSLWILPFGGVTLFLLLNISLLGILHLDFKFVPMALIAGFIADFYLKKRGLSRIVIASGKKGGDKIPNAIEDLLWIPKI